MTKQGLLKSKQELDDLARFDGLGSTFSLSSSQKLSVNISKVASALRLGVEVSLELLRSAWVCQCFVHQG